LDLSFSGLNELLLTWQPEGTTSDELREGAIVMTSRVISGLQAGRWSTAGARLPGERRGRCQRGVKQEEQIAAVVCQWKPEQGWRRIQLGARVPR